MEAYHIRFLQQQKNSEQLTSSWSSSCTLTFYVTHQVVGELLYVASEEEISHQLSHASRSPNLHKIGAKSIGNMGVMLPLYQLSNPLNW